MGQILDFIRDWRAESTKRLDIAEETKRHEQSCERDVGMLHGWQDKKSTIKLLASCIIASLILFKDFILQKLGLK